MAAMSLVSIAVAGALGVTLASGQTQSLPNPGGTLEVSMQADACDETIELWLWELQTSPAGAKGRIGRGGIKGVECKWVFAPLAPGTYQVDLRRPTGSAGSSDAFAVRDRDVTRVVVAPATVQVTGRISAAGGPVAGRIPRVHSTRKAVGRDPGHNRRDRALLPDAGARGAVRAPAQREVGADEFEKRRHRSWLEHG